VSRSHDVKSASCTLRPRRDPRPPYSRYLQLALLACAAGAAIGAVGCNKQRKHDAVIIIGIDGASPHMVNQLVDAGRLPTLAAIAARGQYAPLESIRPYLSPRVWTSIATGKRPEKHGILNWTKPTGETTAELYYSYDRKCHALWNIVSDAGMDVGVVNWLMTFPAEPVKGTMITDHALPSGAAGKRYIGKVFAHGQHRQFVEAPIAATIYPDNWAAEFNRATESAAEFLPFSDPFEGLEPLPDTVPPDLMHQFYTADLQLAAATADLIRRERPRVVMVLLQGIDRVSH